MKGQGSALFPSLSLFPMFSHSTRHSARPIKPLNLDSPGCKATSQINFCYFNRTQSVTFCYSSRKQTRTWAKVESRNIKESNSAQFESNGMPSTVLSLWIARPVGGGFGACVITVRERMWLGPRDTPSPWNMERASRIVQSHFKFQKYDENT